MSPGIGGGAQIGPVSPWLGSIPSPKPLGERILHDGFDNDATVGSDWIEKGAQGRWYQKSSTATDIAVSNSHLVITGGGVWNDPYIMGPATDSPQILASTSYVGMGEFRVEWMLQPDAATNDLLIGIYAGTDITAATDWEPASSQWVACMHYNDSGKIACYALDSDGVVSANDDAVAYTSDDCLGIIKIRSTEINFYYNDTGSTPITGTARTGVLAPRDFRLVVAAKSGIWNIDYMTVWSAADTW